VTSQQNEKHQKRLATFRTVVRDRVAQLNVTWVQLEQGMGDHDMSVGLQRELHTLKGEAFFLGFKPIADLAHVIEDLVAAVAGVEKPLAPEIGDAVLAAFDLVITLSQRAPDAPAPELEALVARLMQVSPLAPGGTSTPAAPRAPAAQLPHAHSDGDVDAAVAVEAHGDHAGDGGDAALPVPTPGDTPRKLSSYSVRVNPKQLDQIRDIIGELLLTRTRLASSAAALHRQRQGQIEQDAATELEPVSEAMSALARDDLLRDIEGQLRDDVLRMSNLVNALDEATRDLRMVSISVVFDRYPVAVRAMSRQLGRQVQLVCQGEAVEADRDVLEALDDPLLHLVRNALSHGIEPPEVRVRAGKPPTGTLTLGASVTGDTLHVEVKDDGAGIDVKAVKQKAIERGLIDPGTARTMTERQVLRCLFEPGMTTRSSIDHHSGRGVGLDVVQKTARNLGGAVEVHSELGVGTTFDLRVPIRASITTVLLFAVGQGRYAVPINTLVALEELEDYPTTTSIDGPALHYKGGLVPLVALEPLLGEAPLSSPDALRGQRVIIVRQGTQHIGLTGSHDHMQREAVLKPVGAMLRDDKLISAGLALEDGSVALVINPAELFKATRGEVDEDISVELTPRSAPVDVQRTVLVVEDSPIVRDLLVEALRAHGLTVLEAVDGQDALDKLGQHPEVNLLVTDVEMPRLDGLGLIKKMRARGGRRIPAVVVSTRGSDADKSAALKVGADAYLVKTDFTREGLWALVSRHLG
jgi:two-component system, chemotaxis family, sensor kinase CheA